MLLIWNQRVPQLDRFLLAEKLKAKLKCLWFYLVYPISSFFFHYLKTCASEKKIIILLLEIVLFADYEIFWIKECYKLFCFYSFK